MESSRRDRSYKTGALVRLKTPVASGEPHCYGVLLDEEHHAVDARFFRVLMPTGNIRLISEHYLELLCEVEDQ